MINDNEKVTFFMAENTENKHFSYIVTRPGMLEDKDTGMQLEASHDSLPMSTAITFKALGTFTVDVLNDESLYGTYPY
jgi:hypothetical protein